jgi:hypothetical protein
MNQMAMDPSMMPGMMPGMGMPQQEEMTDEQKAELQQKMKEEEKKRRKAQIVSLKKQLKHKEMSLNVAEKSLAKMSAEKDVLQNVDLGQAETEWHKKAIQAEIEELEAVLEEGRLRLDYEREAQHDMQKNLQDLEAKDKEENEVKEEKAENKAEQSSESASTQPNSNYL